MGTSRIQQESQPIEDHLLKDAEDGDNAGDCEELDRAIRTLEILFSNLGFYHYQSSVRHRIFRSCALFLLVGFTVPIGVVLYHFCFHHTSSDVKESRIIELDIAVPASQIFLAFTSLFCVSYNLRKYSMWRFLFVDKRYEDLNNLHPQYVEKIKNFYQILLWILPCIIVKSAHALYLIIFINRDPWPLASVILLLSIISWTYLITVFLSGCSLFCLICNLQVVHFEDYCKVLVTSIDVPLLLDDHIRLCHYLSKISHRFRLHLLLVFFVSVASQCFGLLQTTKNGGVVNFSNAGDFFVSSAVQVIGIVLCLNAAIRISHRAQNVSSIASKWHAQATCKIGDNIQTIIPCGYREAISEITILQSLHSQRQAFVMYLQCNNGGITMYGWVVDRGLIATIVCIELSLLTFIFSGSV